VTYSPDHVADGQRLAQLLATLVSDVSDLSHMMSVCDEALTMPARRRVGVDEEGQGSPATSGPSRPTERIALDPARDRIKREQLNGTTYITHAIACVRGVTAALDRALAVWEGEEPALTTLISGGANGSTDGAATDGG
jgi:hypothetical protein